MSQFSVAVKCWVELEEPPWEHQQVLELTVEALKSSSPSWMMNVLPQGLLVLLQALLVLMPSALPVLVPLVLQVPKWLVALEKPLLLQSQVLMEVSLNLSSFWKIVENRCGALILQNFHLEKGMVFPHMALQHPPAPPLWHLEDVEFCWATLEMRAGPLERGKRNCEPPPAEHEALMSLNPLAGLQDPSVPNIPSSRSVVFHTPPRDPLPPGARVWWGC